MKHFPIPNTMTVIKIDYIKINNKVLVQENKKKRMKKLNLTQTPHY